MVIALHLLSMQDLDESTPESQAAEAMEQVPSKAKARPVIRERFKQLAAMQLKPEQVLLRDKLGFFLGVVNLW